MQTTNQVIGNRWVTQLAIRNTTPQDQFFKVGDR